MQKEEKLEEFRSFRTSKRQKQRVKKERNKEAAKENILKLRFVLCEKNSNEKQSN